MPIVACILRTMRVFASRSRLNCTRSTRGSELQPSWLNIAFGALWRGLSTWVSFSGLGLFVQHKKLDENRNRSAEHWGAVGTAVLGGVLRAQKARPDDEKCKVIVMSVKLSN